MAELIVQWQEGNTQRSQRIQSHPPDASATSITIGRNPKDCDVVLPQDHASDLQVEIAQDAQRWYLRWSPLADSTQEKPIVNGQMLKTEAIVLDTINTVQLGQVLLNVAIKPDGQTSSITDGPACPVVSRPPNRPRSQPPRPPLRAQASPPPVLLGLVGGLLGVIMLMGSLALITQPRIQKFVDIPLEDYEFNPLQPSVSGDPTPQTSTQPTLTLEQLETLTQDQLAAKNITLAQLTCDSSDVLEIGQTMACQATVADLRPFELQITAKSTAQVTLKPETGVFFTQTVTTQIRNWAQTQQAQTRQAQTRQVEDIENIQCPAGKPSPLILDYPNHQFTCAVETPQDSQTLQVQVEGDDLTFSWQTDSPPAPLDAPPPAGEEAAPSTLHEGHEFFEANPGGDSRNF